MTVVVNVRPVVFTTFFFLFHLKTTHDNDGRFFLLPGFKNCIGIMSVTMTISAIKLLNKEDEYCDQGQQRLKKKKIVHETDRKSVAVSKKF